MRHESLQMAIHVFNISLLYLFQFTKVYFRFVETIIKKYYLTTFAISNARKAFSRVQNIFGPNQVFFLPWPWHSSMTFKVIIGKDVHITKSSIDRFVSE